MVCTFLLSHANVSSPQCFITALHCRFVSSEDDSEKEDEEKEDSDWVEADSFNDVLTREGYGTL